MQVAQITCTEPRTPAAERKGALNRELFKDISGNVIDDFYTLSTLGPCPCAGDVTGDAVVDILDFLTVLASWGEQSDGPPDIDGDGIVGLTEFLLVIALWGPCQELSGARAPVAQ